MVQPLFRTALSVALMFTAPVTASSLIIRDSNDPTDYSWIKKFAAVGDSFTAGIGSGDLYSDNDNSYECSRYSYTYPTIMNHFFGPSIETFTYTACSGAITTGIFEQVNALDEGQDLVILTAGGNDLCLSTMIDKCIAGANPNEDDCDSAIAHAKSGLADGGYFKQNIKDLLTAIDSKMATNGIVVQVLYAQYFNDQTDDCTSEDWQIIDLSAGPGLALTKERRTTFNSLVLQTNTVIKEAVEEVAATAKTMTLVTADWDPWAPLTGGQFCEPGASPDPTDESNDSVMFFKLFTGNTAPLEARSLYSYNYYGNTSYGIEPFPLAMNKRDPVDPGCPKSSISLPDSIGKIFHPNNLGHEVIAAYTLDAIADARASILGQDPVCPIIDSMTCYSSQGSTAYASSEALNNNIDDFCEYVTDNAPTNEAGWSRSKNYYSGSLDEYTMAVSLSDHAAAFDEDACKAAISKIINGCDVPSGGSNPMNWKGGGKRVEGEFTYTVNIYRTNRPWPPPSEPSQQCEGWYKFLFQSYDIYGAGWATYDWGQKTLMKQVNPCCGSGSLTGWTFDYFDEPDENGYEWHAFFHTAIGTRRRCFDNNKVQCAAGGPCDSYCKGNG
ncbi:SGNH hydrolase-type esterase domain-containing protein [Xylogone sp. PMI_703]|nr:SGNH hydrolase-type esterase domain-containing protein [Xylogone sp. PMI_703]